MKETNQAEEFRNIYAAYGARIGGRYCDFQGVLGVLKSQAQLDGVRARLVAAGGLEITRRLPEPRLVCSPFGQFLI